jgi:hypothetical protein
MLLGSVVFLVSLFAMRQLLVGSGMLDPLASLLFLSCLVGIPLGGILLLEGAFDAEQRRLRQDLEAMRRELSELERRVDGEDRGA